MTDVAAPFVPAGFVVPTELIGDGFRLEPLGPEHNERDHQAWMSSIDHIRATPGFRPPQHTWPEEMSLDQKLADLEAHAVDFVGRRGFTYSVLDGEEVIGCVYIYPTTKPDHDCEVRSWVTATRAGTDRVLWAMVTAWLREVWPFSRPHYDARP